MPRLKKKSTAMKNADVQRIKQIKCQNQSEEEKNRTRETEASRARKRRLNEEVRAEERVKDKDYQSKRFRIDDAYCKAHIKKQNERLKDPANRAIHNDRQKKSQSKRLKDPENRSIHNEKSKKSQSERLKDPENRSIHNEKSKKSQSERLKDPENRSIHNEKSKKSQVERLRDPANRAIHNEKQKKSQSKRLKDLENRSIHSEKSKKSQSERLKDPVNRAIHNEKQKRCQRERLKDPENRSIHIEKSKKSQSERLKDPVNRAIHNEKQKRCQRERLKDPKKHALHKKCLKKIQNIRLKNPKNREIHRKKLIENQKIRLSNISKRNEHRLRNRIAQSKRLSLGVYRNRLNFLKRFHYHKKNYSCTCVIGKYPPRLLSNNRGRNELNFLCKTHLHKSLRMQTRQRALALARTKKYVTKKHKTQREILFEKYRSNVKKGPDEVCCCCGRLFFPSSMRSTRKMKSRQLNCQDFEEFIDDICDPIHTEGLGYDTVCGSCAGYLKQMKVPPLSLSKYPQLKFPKVPEAVLKLTLLEERFVAPRIAFMQIMSFRKHEQYSVQGRVVNVPVDVEQNVSILPRSVEELGVVPVALKKKRSYKSVEIMENVMPRRIAKALKELEGCPIYKEANVEIDMARIPLMMTECENEYDDNSSTEAVTMVEEKKKEDFHIQDDSDFEEFDPEPINLESEQTVLISNQQSEALVFTPGEGFRPLPLFLDNQAEAMTFIRIYGGALREKISHLSYQKVAKSELMRFDRRCAADPVRLFYYALKLRAMKVAESAMFCLRKTQGEKKNNYTAAFCLSDDLLKSFHSFDCGYQIFSPDRGSPAFWQQKQKELFAMIRQLGPPTLFLTLSPAETQWSELLVILKKNVDKEVISEEAALGLCYEEKTRLIRSDPVTCALYFDYKTRLMFKLMTTPVIGIFEKHHVKDFYFRIEFQMRGSPHVHALLWLSDAPSFALDKSEESRKACIEFIDRFISCSSQTCNEITRARQTHRHSFTCKKKNKKTNISRCRFHFPQFPMKETMILDPLETAELSNEKRKTLSQQLANVEGRLNELYKSHSRRTSGEVPDFDSFLSSLGLSLEEYILTIRFSLSKTAYFHVRSPEDIRMNPYVPDVSELHQANMDAQFVLDMWPVARYIVQYVLKVRSGVSKMFKEVEKELAAGNYSLRDKIKLMTSKFLDCSEFSAQEAVYYILSLHLSSASRVCDFINTGRPEKRVSVMLPKKILRALPKDSLDVFCKSKMDHYVNRPEELKDVCLADFVAWYNYFPKSKASKSTKDDDDDDQSSGLQSSDDEDERCETDKKSVGCKKRIKNKTTLQTFQLKNNDGIVRKRTKSKVLRYVRFNIETQEDDYYREQLMLFVPWNDEEKDLLQVNAKLKFIEYESLIKKNRKGYIFNETFEAEENHLFELVKQLNDEDGDKNDGDEPQEQLDPMDGFNVLRDRTDEGNILYDVGYDANCKNEDIEYIPIPFMLPDDRYLDIMRSLNNGQQKFNLQLLHKAKRNEEQILECVIGPAGTGKSRLIAAIAQSHVREYNKLDRIGEESHRLDTLKVVLCAPTGRAAFNIGGSTIHSVAILPFNQSTFEMPPLSASVRNTAYCRMKDVKLVIIDEVSMVGSKMIASIDKRFREIFRRPDLPFGGLSVVLFGDFNQLRPVGDAYIFQPNRANPYSEIFGIPLWERFTFYQLTEIMRQKNDIPFAQALSNLAKGQLTPIEIDMFKSRQTKKVNIVTLPAVRLFRTNDEVGNYNDSVLKRKKTEGFTVIEFHAIDKVLGTVSADEQKNILKYTKKLKTSSTFGLPSLLKLCVGIRYLVSVNVRTEDGITNGSVGILRHIETYDNGNVKRLWMFFDNEEVGKKTRRDSKNLYTQPGIESTWTPINLFTRNIKPRLNSPILVMRKQYPVVPAEAITIYKSQGGTYESIVVNVTPRMTRRELYVACSRATSLEGLHIIGEFKSPAPVSSEDVVEKEISHCLMNKPVNMKLLFLQDFPNNFSIIFHNVNSFRKHYADVVSDICFISAKIIILVESWLTKSELFSIPGFKCFYRADIQNRKPHAYGIIVFVREELFDQAKLIFEYNNENRGMNCNIVAFSVKGWNVCGVYKAPSNNSLNYWEQLTNMLDRVKTINENHNTVILGDFNDNLLGVDSNRTVKFFNRYGFKQSLPPESSTNAGTQIDLCFTNSQDMHTCYYECYFSPHKPIICIEGFTPECPVPPLPTLDPKSIGITGASIRNKKYKTKNLRRIESSDEENIAPEENVNRMTDVAHDLKINTPTIETHPVEELHNVDASSVAISSFSFNYYPKPISNDKHVECYGISAMQALLTISEFRHRIISTERIMNECELTVKSFVEKALDHSTIQPLQITDIRKTLASQSQHLRIFASDREQQDSCEFLQNLIEYLPLLKDLIEFHGFDLHSCPREECHYTTRCQPNSDTVFRTWFPPNIPAKMSFSSFFSPRETDRTCPSCQRGLLQGKFFFSDEIPAPNYLIFHLPRYSYNRESGASKIETTFHDFNPDSINLYGHTYRVLSVIYHLGDDVQSGHYTTVIRTENDEWIMCDDQAIYSITRFDCSLKNAYIMIFEKKPEQQEIIKDKNEMIAENFDALGKNNILLQLDDQMHLQINEPAHRSVLDITDKDEAVRIALKNMSAPNTPAEPIEINLILDLINGETHISTLPWSDSLFDNDPTPAKREEILILKGYDHWHTLHYDNNRSSLKIYDPQPDLIRKKGLPNRETAFLKSRYPFMSNTIDIFRSCLQLSQASPHNSHDDGIFCMVFACSIALGENPSEFLYYNPLDEFVSSDKHNSFFSLRNHIMVTIKNKKLMPFSGGEHIDPYHLSLYKYDKSAEERRPIVQQLRGITFDKELVDRYEMIEISDSDSLSSDIIDTIEQTKRESRSLHLEQIKANLLPIRSWLNDLTLDSVLSLIKVKSSFHTLPVSVNFEHNRYTETKEKEILILGSSNHWRCSYFDGSKLTIYDSLGMSAKCRRNVVKPMEKAILKTRYPEASKQVIFESCQQQPDQDSCGVFAALNALALSNHINPSTQLYFIPNKDEYSIAKLRQFLYEEVIVKQTISPFPAINVGTHYFNFQ